MSKIKKIINKLQLVQHPEGGYFIETFRSPHHIAPSFQNQEPSSAGTSILYMLTNENENSSFSGFHTLTGKDELWFYNGGANIIIHIIEPKTGILRSHILGSVENDAVPQVRIPADHPFAAELVVPKDQPGEEYYGLVSCIVVPGFEYSCFKLCNPQELSQAYPEHSATISRLARAIEVVPVPTYQEEKAGRAI